MVVSGPPVASSVSAALVSVAPAVDVGVSVGSTAMPAVDVAVELDTSVATGVSTAGVVGVAVSS
jgi:hypothetical protein